MSETDRELISYMLKHDLLNPHGYVTNLQYIYNNTKHFSEQFSDVCDNDTLRQLSFLAWSPTEEIIIQGNMHSNYHASKVVRNALDNSPIFVKDTYIRFRTSSNPKIQHLLILPPVVQQFVPIYLDYSSKCPPPNLYILPDYSFPS